MTEWSGQVFPALELGPGCLVLGINGGPPLAEGPLGAADWRNTRWTALEKISMSTFSRGLAVITRPQIWMSRLHSYLCEEVPM